MKTDRQPGKTRSTRNSPWKSRFFPAQRRAFWAKTLAAETEFWRFHRQAAGVLHFCSLGYNRRSDVPQPVGGATCDHWVDVKRLKWDADFDRYVRDAFAPVGLMLDFWTEEVRAGSEHDLTVAVVNDLPTDWRGEVRLRLVRAGKTLWTEARTLQVPALGRARATFHASFAVPPGDGTLIAEYRDSQGDPIASRRDLRIMRNP